MPRLVRGGGLWRALAYGAAGVGLITTLTAMFALHPHQQVYFNALVDTKTPGALVERYDMDYWELAYRQLLEHLLARYPYDTLRIWPDIASRVILPSKDRDRIVISYSPHSADFYLWTARGYKLRAENPRQGGFYHPFIDPRNIPDKPPIHSVKAYGNAIALIYGKDTDAYHAAYDDISANGDSIESAAFALYAYDGALYYLSANCGPPAPNDADFRVFLHFYPVNRADLPADRREHGFENRDFWFNEHAAFFDGKCVNRQPLPDYAIASIRTGRNAAASGGDGWRVDIDLAARAEGQALYEGITAGNYGQPFAQSNFDIYLRDGVLVYLKENCAPGDTHARIFLHITPANPADLPAANRERGFANLDFHFADHGARIGDICLATRELPAYPLDRIRTGQFVSGESAIWRAEFPATR